jgi:hypothetical protein
VNSTLSVLCRFFRREIPRLPSTYKWKIPEIPGFRSSGQSKYEINRDLKRYLTDQWGLASDHKRLELASVIVSDWGGVRSNSSNTLQQYVLANLRDKPETRLKGVASYSKILAIAQPDRYAIYDARVAACLNAVQINAGLRKGLAFNYVPGRNNIVGNTVTKRGFTQLSEFSVRSLCRSGWSRIKRDETYQWYLDTLSACLARLRRYSLVELEMALFSNAEGECQLAMRDIGPHYRWQRWQVS